MGISFGYCSQILIEMNSERIDYLDCFRGLAMTMVVYCHVSGFVLGIKEDWIVYRFSEALMLPMFFFVSGWLSHLYLTIQNIGKRALYVLTPTIIMFLIYVGVRSGGYDNLIHSLRGEYKSGYWFPLALFVMNALHCFSSYIHKQRDTHLLGGLWLWAMALIVLKLLDIKYNGGNLCQWGSLRLISTYFPFYVFGVTAKKYSELFHRMMKIKWLIITFLALFLFLLFSIDLGWVRGMARCFLGLLLIYAFFYKYQEYFSSKTVIGRQFVIIGRYTLPIYLIHYFFFLMLDLKWLPGCVVGQLRESVMTFVAIALAVAIIYASLLLRYLISLCPPLYRVLLGK